MPYIGVSPQFGVRRKHTYTATAGQTSFSGAGSEGATLSYKDSNFVDVYQNGVKLGDADYTSTSGTAIVLAQGASVDDLVEIIVFDAFSAADTVSKADGGQFDGAVTLAGGVAGGVVFNDDSASVDFRIESNDDANMFFLDGSANAIGIRTATDHGGQLNVETTGQAYNVVLACTDDDANHGPLLDFKRISSSPADGDLLGEISFRGRNDNSEDITYATISSTLKDASDGTEDGNLFFNVMVAGTSRELLTVTKDSVVVNQDSQDIDFRVESDALTHALFVQAGSGGVGIGESSPNSYHANADDLVVSGSGSGSVGITIRAESGHQSTLAFADGTTGDTPIQGRILYNHNGDSMNFYTNGANERMRIFNSGAVALNITSNPVSASGNVTGGHYFTANSYTAFSKNGGVVSYFNRTYSDGNVIAIRQDGTDVGFISVSGTTTSYGAFSGAHWSRLSDNSKPTILRGTIIETIDEMCDWYQVKFEVDGEMRKVSYALKDNEKVGDTITYTYKQEDVDDADYQATIIKEDDNKHTKCKISDTADSTRVYGVYTAWDDDDDTVNDMHVTACGTHVVRINKDVTVKAGDLLSSNGDGTAKVQDDDIIRSKTIGKVLTNIKQETYSDGSYTVPCALYCG